MKISNVALGTVKWFDVTEGYGFIQPQDGGPHVFVHISAAEKAGFTGLAEGAKVGYELVNGRSSKVSAENLRIGQCGGRPDAPDGGGAATA
jgi:cold shock protein